MDRSLAGWAHRRYIDARRLAHRALRRVPVLDVAARGALRKLTHPIESKLAALALPSIVDVGGIKMSYEPADIRIVSRLVSGHYEPEVAACFRERIKPGATAVDCGAHVGWYTLNMARLVGPSGRVFAFEAVPRTAATLRRNVELNGHGNVTVVQKAVTDRAGTVDMVASTTSSGINSMFGKPGPGSAVVTVESTSLDEFFAGAGWPKVDFAKIDIEGAEKLAIAGMRELVQRNPDIELVVEVNLQTWPLPELLATLREAGFGHLRALELGRDLVTAEDEALLVDSTRVVTPNLLCRRG